MSRILATALCVLFALALSVNSFQSNRARYSDKTHNARSLLLHGSAKDRDGYFTISDIEDYAKISGLTLNCTATGPLLRIEAFPTGDEELIGYLTAFIRPLPFGLFHLDTIKVKNRRQNLGYQRKNWTIDGPGISFIMGSYALRWAYEKGCRTSQLLAVNDSPLMHAILIRLYQR
jgi:hypothetical protein